MGRELPHGDDRRPSRGQQPRGAAQARPGPQCQQHSRHQEGPGSTRPLSPTSEGLSAGKTREGRTQMPVPHSAPRAAHRRPLCVPCTPLSQSGGDGLIAKVARDVSKRCISYKTLSRNKTHTAVHNRLHVWGQMAQNVNY